MAALCEIDRWVLAMHTGQVPPSPLLELSKLPACGQHVGHTLGVVDALCEGGDLVPERVVHLIGVVDFRMVVGAGCLDNGVGQIDPASAAFREHLALNSRERARFFGATLHDGGLFRPCPWGSG